MGAYADVNGVHMYYEEHGGGEPLALLHGGVGGVPAWRAQIPALAERYRVLAPEMRGRGHTADVPGDITYQAMADDVIAFLEQVVDGSAFVVGGSDGGVVGLIMAMQRPDLVRKLVTIGGNFHQDGLVPGTMWFETGPDDDTWAGPRGMYEEVSPDGPEHWPVLFAKMQRMWNAEPLFTTEEIATIPIPTLVMVGDDDAITMAHTVELYEALPQGQLAVIPGTSHAAFMEKPDLVNRIILDFLAEEGPPQTIVPIRRTRPG